MPTLPPTDAPAPRQRPTSLSEQPPANRPAAANVRLAKLTAPVESEAALSTSVTFTWTPVEGAQAYEVQVAQDDRFADVIHRVRSSDASATVFDAFEPGHAYRWRVRHQDVHGRWGATTLPATFSTVPPSIPGRRMRGSTVPTPLMPVAGAPADATSLGLSWTPVDGASSYNVQITRSPDFSDVDLDLPLGPSSALTLVRLLPELGVRYAWRVRAQVAGKWTPWSARATFRAATDDEAGAHEVAYLAARSASDQQLAREALARSIEQAEVEAPHRTSGSSSSEALWFILLIVLGFGVTVGLLLFNYLR